MNLTEFKAFIKPKLNNSCEKRRLNHLCNRTYKFIAQKDFKLSIKNINEKNAAGVWHNINVIMSSWERLARQTRHQIKNSKIPFVDYSNQAYNNSADDL